MAVCPIADYWTAEELLEECCRGVSPWAPFSNLQVVDNREGVPTEGHPYNVNEPCCARLLLSHPSYVSLLRCDEESFSGPLLTLS